MQHPLLTNSYGSRPEVVQDDMFPEGIVALDFCEEARTLIIGTGSGQLIRLNRQGDQLQRVSGFSGIRALAWSDAGTFGAVALEGGRFLCVDKSFDTEWDARVTGEVGAIAVSPFGSHFAFSTESCRVHIVTTEKKETASFETLQRQDYLHFLHEAPLLIGAAEFGHLCCHRLNGDEEWNERIVNNVGAMAVTGCGKRILLAAFNHGIQVMNRYGKLEGSFAVDGVPNRVAASSTRRRFAATTIEHRLYWLNFDGDLVWGCDFSSDPVVCMDVDPMGDRLFIATQSGRLLQLTW